MIQKIKRLLSRVKILSPIEKLIYNDKEIERMKKKGKIYESPKYEKRTAEVEVIIKDDILNDWIEWNKRKISGDEFANRFFKKYKKECLRVWNNS